MSDDLDHNTAPAAPQSPSPVLGKSLRWLLIGSLAINLGVVGLAIGALLHGGPDGRGDAIHDLGFGPYDQALRPEDREQLKTAFKARSGDLKARRGELVADARAVLAALRNDPFDAAALEAALATQQDHLTARMKLGNDTMLQFFTGLSQEDRLAFADRLEQRLKRGRMPEDAPKN